MKVRIVAIGKQDAFYKSSFHPELIGSMGEFQSVLTAKGGFRGGDFKIDPEYKELLSGKVITFYRVKVHQIK